MDSIDSIQLQIYIIPSYVILIILYIS